MKIAKSTYNNNIFFAGYDDTLTDAQLTAALNRHYGLQDGSDFDGLTREDMEASHTNTEDDLDTFSELFEAYDHVEYVTLQPVR